MPKTVQLRSNNEILMNIFRLIKIKGVRQSDLAKYLGISKNAISQWKISKSSSYMKYIDQLAVFFDVSPEDLLYPDKSNLHDSFLSQDEMELVSKSRQLKDDQLKKALIAVAASLASVHVCDEKTNSSEDDHETV